MKSRLTERKLIKSGKITNKISELTIVNVHVLHYFFIAIKELLWKSEKDTTIDVKKWNNILIFSTNRRLNQSSSWKYALAFSTSGIIVLLPLFQLAGQTSPCLSVNWKASTNLMISETDLPTGKSFIVIWRIMPFGSIINNPRNGIPSFLR